MVSQAKLVTRWPVKPDRTGSSPVRHPKFIGMPDGETVRGYHVNANIFLLHLVGVRTRAFKRANF